MNIYIDNKNININKTISQKIRIVFTRAGVGRMLWGLVGHSEKKVIFKGDIWVLGTTYSLTRAVIAQKFTV